MRMKYVYFLILAISLPFISANAQVDNGKKATEALKEYFIRYRSNLTLASPASVLENKENEKEILQLLTSYSLDTMEELRSKAYDISKQIGLKSAKGDVRQKAVNNLLEGYKDRSSGINGTVSKALTRFSKEDFDENAKNTVRKLLTERRPYFDKLLQITGFLDLSDQKSVIISLLTNNASLNSKEKWSAHLALARLRDEKAMEYCINKIKKLPVNDDMIYEVVPDLVYIRQPEAINYLVNILYSEDKNCGAADSESNENILCGYRVMEYLAPIIQDFPFKTDSSGDLDVKDYEAALKTSRNWFKERGSDYVILADSF